MSFKQTLEKIENSPQFQDFKINHPNAELVAGFFILDFFSNDNKQTLDYKDQEKIFTFNLTQKDEIFTKEDELIKNTTHPPLTKINPETKIEVEELKGLAGTQALDNGISAKFHKIIAVLQKHQDKQIWNLTCMLEGLIILNILIDSQTGEIIKFDRKSMMDMIKKK